MLNADMSEEDLLRAAARVDNHTPQPPEYPDGRKFSILKSIAY